MILSIHQPHFFPWLGYFHKIAKSNAFVFLDDVQYRKNYFQNRCTIKGISNNPLWLTVAIKNAPLGTNINETSISEVFNPQKLITTIRSNYAKFPFFKELSEGIFSILENKYSTLSQLNFEALKHILNILQIEKEIILSSSLNLNELDANLRIIKICKELNADYYLAGKGGLNYMDMNLFAKNNIEILWQKFNPNDYQYNQNNMEFTAGLSILDVLFSIGATETNKLLLSSNDV